MSGSKTARSKKMKKLKKEFLLTSKKCWLIEEKLLPLYQHIVDDYSDKLREEWVKEEQSDVEATPQVKEEPLDDYLVEPRPVHLNNSTDQFKVILIIPLAFLINQESHPSSYLWEALGWRCLLQGRLTSLSPVNTVTLPEHHVPRGQSRRRVWSASVGLEKLVDSRLSIISVVVCCLP